MKQYETQNTHACSHVIMRLKTPKKISLRNYHWINLSKNLQKKKKFMHTFVILLENISDFFLKKYFVRYNYIQMTK